MSILPIGPDSHAKKYFTERLGKLLNFDEVRIMELLESFQYGIAYILICFFLGVGLDFIFPKFDEDTEVGTLFFEIVLQCLALIGFVFYGRKLVKVMPFMFFFHKHIFGQGGVPSYQAYKSTEYEGEVVIGFVLVATQANLLKKIDKLSRTFYEWMYGEKRDIEKKIVQEKNTLQKS